MAGKPESRRRFCRRRYERKELGRKQKVRHIVKIVLDALIGYISQYTRACYK